MPTNDTYVPSTYTTFSQARKKKGKPPAYNPFAAVPGAPASVVPGALLPATAYNPFAAVSGAPASVVPGASPGGGYYYYAQNSPYGGYGYVPATYTTLQPFRAQALAGGVTTPGGAGGGYGRWYSGPYRYGTGGGAGWYGGATGPQGETYGGGWGNANLVSNLGSEERPYYVPSGYGDKMYGLSDLNVDPVTGELTGSLNRYGQPLGTTAPLQTTHRRLGGRNYRRRRTPEEVEQINRQQGKLGPTIQDIHKYRKGKSGGGGGGSGGGGSGSSPNWYNDMINWNK